MEGRQNTSRMQRHVEPIEHGQDFDIITKEIKFDLMMHPNRHWFDVDYGIAERADMQEVTFVSHQS
jgi:hypothetical protein